MNRKQNILSGIIIVCGVVFLLALSEGIARSLTNSYILSYYKPIELVKQHEQEEELRLTNVFSGPESEFEYDPVLFWRPKKNWGIFNELGIRGESVTSNLDNTSSSCTIAAYGDSNTLGAFQGGYFDSPWPEELSKLLRQHTSHFRVLNMGVSGYSSYQGLERFRQDIDIFHPSLVFVAFGWNDASPDMGIPDKEFNSLLSLLLSPLNKSRLFQVIKYYSDIVFYRFIRKPGQNGPRVSFTDFRLNLIEFIRLARDNNIPIVLLTRPHADFTHADIDNWRLRVTVNNRILHEVASQYNVPLIDMEELFLNQYPNELIDDCHFTENGHAIAAKEIYSFLQREQLLCN